MKKANNIYRGLIGICEKREAEGAYKGNGHHLAQKLTVSVLIELLPKKQRKVYDALTRQPQTAKQIRKKTGIDTKEISVLVKQIQREGDLVATDRKVKPFKYKQTCSKIMDS